MWPGYFCAKSRISFKHYFRLGNNPVMKTTLDEMQAFLAVIDSGSITGAAETLRLTVSAVSRALGRLEKNLGVTLLTRTTRRLRAEEAAAKIALKLLFPLIFFIFPSLMLVLLGPAFINIYRVLLPALAGQ